MNKKVFLAVVIGISSFGAISCKIDYSTNKDNIKNIVSLRNGIFLRDPERLCSILEAQKLSVFIDGSIETKSGKIIAKATATVKDKIKNKFSPVGIGHGVINIEHPVNYKTDDILYSAINQATDSINIDEAVSYLKKSE